MFILVFALKMGVIVIPGGWFCDPFQQHVPGETFVLRTPPPRCSMLINVLQMIRSPFHAIYGQTTIISSTLYNHWKTHLLWLMGLCLHSNIYNHESQLFISCWKVPDSYKIAIKNQVNFIFSSNLCLLQICRLVSLQLVQAYETASGPYWLVECFPQGWIKWFLTQEQGFKMKTPLHIPNTSMWWFPQFSLSFPGSGAPCSRILSMPGFPLVLLQPGKLGSSEKCTHYSMHTSVPKICTFWHIGKLTLKSAHGGLKDWLRTYNCNSFIETSQSILSEFHKS